MTGHRYITNFLLVFAFVVMLPGYSNSADILFHDDFDSHQTWSDISGSPTPKGWTGYSTNWSPIYGYGLPDGEIKADAHYRNEYNRGKKGKGFRVNVDRNWAAAGLHKLFSGEDTKHDQLYFRWYQRYSKNFHWDKTVPNSPGHKWIRLGDETTTKILRIGLGTGALYWYGQVTMDGMYFNPPFTWEVFNHGYGGGNNWDGSKE
jgi:hypothetical protein